MELLVRATGPLVEQREGAVGGGLDAEAVALDRVARFGCVLGRQGRGRPDGVGAEAIELDDRRLHPRELDQAAPAIGEEVDRAGGSALSGETVERAPLEL